MTDGSQYHIDGQQMVSDQSLHVNDNMCNRRGVAFGGLLFGAAIDVAEKVSKRALFSASIHYLRPAMCGDQVRFVSGSPDVGRTFTFLPLTGVGAGKPVFNVQARLKELKSSDDYFQPCEFPEVPRASECEPLVTNAADRSGSIWDLVDIRPVQVSTEGSSVILWIRFNCDLLGPRGRLAILSDWAPTAFGLLDQRFGKGASVDAYLRIIRSVAVDWTLVHFDFPSRSPSIVRANATLWTEHGHVLAHSMQSFVPLQEV